MYIVNELDLWSEDLDADFNLKIYLFRTVTLTKIADPNKYSYSRYGIGADFLFPFLFPSFDWDNNVVIFGVDNSSSGHIDNKKKDI